MAGETLPIGVITGFLGSGKTTLLNALLGHPELEDTAVLVNEFGEVGIDHLLVEALEDEDVVLLNAGCLCCTVRDDLVACLSSLWEKREAGTIPAFRRCLIETTGLADPAPILHTLLAHERLRGRYTVDGIIATVDALNGERSLSEHPECLRQAAVCDRLVVTKADLAEAHALEALVARLGAINPGAPIARAVNGEIDIAHVIGIGLFDAASKSPDVRAWLAAAADEHDTDHEAHRHDERIGSFAIEASRPLELYRLVAWIERTLEAHGERLLRMKGVLDVLGRDAPVVVHGVQHIFHPLAELPRWPGAERRSRIVVIGKDLDREQIRESFRRTVSGE